MNPIPQQSEAKPDLARTLRESCVRFTEAADESLFFRQLYLLLASLFGKIEDMFLLWREGKLPPPPVHTRAPALRPSAPTARKRHNAARTPGQRRPKSVSARPIRARGTAARHPSPPRSIGPTKPNAPARRIDRYPKTAAMLRSEKRRQAVPF